jgi:hypothetical protein
LETVAEVFFERLIMPMPNTKPEQDLMNDGPGLKQRNRETAAVSTAVMPASGASGTVAKPASPPAAVDKVNRGKFGSKPGEKRINVSDMTKPLGVLHTGTDYVPKTGNYTLQKGEAVVSKEKNKMNPYAKITDGDKKSKKEISHIKTSKTHDGKYTHEHHHTHPEHHPVEHHVSDNQEKMIDHMQEHMGEPNPGEAEANAGQSGVPEAGAGPAQAQGGALGMGGQ